MRPRLVLADEDTLTREGLKLLLAPEFEVVGAVADGQALLAAVKSTMPDAVLLSVSLPVLNGIEAARALRKAAPDVKLVFVATHSDAGHAVEALRAGATGYITKRAEPAELFAAIREALRGGQYVSPQIANSVMGHWFAKAGREQSPKPLTPRQREVLQLTAEGRTRKEIAAALSISVKTVEFHRAVLMRELDLKSPADFTRYAIEHGIISTKRNFANSPQTTKASGRPGTRN